MPIRKCNILYTLLTEPTSIWSRKFHSTIIFCKQCTIDADQMLHKWPGIANYTLSERSSILSRKFHGITAQFCKQCTIDDDRIGTYNSVWSMSGVLFSPTTTMPHSAVFRTTQSSLCIISLHVIYYLLMTQSNN